MTSPNVLLVSLDEQIAHMNREIAYRLRTNPARVAAGKVSQRQADRSLDVLRAILATLQAAKVAQEAKSAT